MRTGFAVKTLLMITGVAYLGIMAAMYVLQRDLIYVRDTTRTAPAGVGLADVTERTLPAPDGEKIIAWYGKAKPGQPTILYFHGNGGALEVRRERMRKYLDRGRGMLMMAYRGYSGSTGSPSEANIIADAMLAYDTLIKDGIAAHDIIIYGDVYKRQAERGGNCELTEPGKTIETPNGVKIAGPLNLAGTIAVNSSSLYAKNLLAFIDLMFDKKEKTLAVNWDDDIIKGTLVAKGGTIVHPNLAPKSP